MTTTRIVEETLCKHGEAVAHEFKYRHDCPGNDDGACVVVEPCPGGSRRTLTEGQYLAQSDFTEQQWTDIIELAQWFDALSDHTEGTP